MLHCAAGTLTYPDVVKGPRLGINQFSHPKVDILSYFEMSARTYYTKQCKRPNNLPVIAAF